MYGLTKLKKTNTDKNINREAFLSIFFRAFCGSLSTVVGDEKLTSREDRKGLLFLDVQGDEYTLSKVDKVSKTKSQTFDVFNQLVSSFKFCV